MTNTTEDKKEPPIRYCRVCLCYVRKFEGGWICEVCGTEDTNPLNEDEYKEETIKHLTTYSTYELKEALWRKTKKPQPEIPENAVVIEGVVGEHDEVVDLIRKVEEVMFCMEYGKKIKLIIIPMEE